MYHEIIILIGVIAGMVFVYKVLRLFVTLGKED